jgi:hypothetical protein
MSYGERAVGVTVRMYYEKLLKLEMEVSLLAYSLRKQIVCLKKEQRYYKSNKD